MISPRHLLRRLDVGVRRHVTLADVSDRLAELHGDAELVTEEVRPGETRSITFADAGESVAAWSAAVAARSRPGVPVVVATQNGIDQFLLCLAVARAGGLPVPVNPQMTSREIGHVIADSGADLVIRDAGELASGKGSRTRPGPPHPADPDRRRRALLHVGNHRQAQGRHAHPRLAGPCRRSRRRCGRDGSGGTG